MNASLALGDQLGMSAETWLARLPGNADQLFLAGNTAANAEEQAQ